MGQRPGQPRVGAEPRRIVLVEDELFIRLALAHDLSDAGFVVLQAGDASTGLELLQSSKIDLLITQTMLHDLGCEVIGVAHTLADATAMIQAHLHRLDAVALDINLGGEDAAPLAALLEAHDIPFIITTGYDDAPLLQAYNGRPVLTKPFLTEHLAEVLMPLVPDTRRRSAH